MPAEPPVAFATLAAPLPAPKPQILGITPTTLSNHLVLRHGEPFLTVADNQTLQAVEKLEAHTRPVTAVTCERGSIWSAGEDALVVGWDERSRRPATEIKAFIKHALPLTALTTHDLDNLVIGGTDLDGSQAHIIYWDTRNIAEPAYVHSSTHTDAITHLSLPPPTATWAAGQRHLPPQLLLSASADGCLALSDLREDDEEAAIQGAAGWGVPIDDAGAYAWKGGLRVWARAEDAVATWGVGPNEEGDLQCTDYSEMPKEHIGKTIKTPAMGPNIVHPAMEERPYAEMLRTHSLIGVSPSLGVNKAGMPMVGMSSEDGNIVLQHTAKDALVPSAFLVTGPGPRGHKSAVRAMHHAARDEALYTGSEDGVLAGWSLASLPRLVCGDPEVDDDGGDGREDIDSEDESEIETEESEEESEKSDRSDRSEGEEEEDEGPRWGRHGPVYGGGSRR